MGQYPNVYGDYAKLEAKKRRLIAAVGADSIQLLTGKVVISHNCYKDGLVHGKVMQELQVTTMENITKCMVVTPNLEL